MSEVASKYLARYRTISTPRFKMVVECSTLISLIPSGLFSLLIDCKLALCTTFRLQHIRAFFSGGPPQSLLLVLATGFCIKESLAPDPEIPELRSALVSESFLVLDRNLYLIFADYFFSAWIFDVSSWFLNAGLYTQPASPCPTSLKENTNKDCSTGRHENASEFVKKIIFG